MKKWHTANAAAPAALGLPNRLQAERTSTSASTKIRRRLRARHADGWKGGNARIARFCFFVFFFFFSFFFCFFFFSIAGLVGPKASSSTRSIGQGDGRLSTTPSSTGLPDAGKVVFVHYRRTIAVFALSRRSRALLESSPNHDGIQNAGTHPRTLGFSARAWYGPAQMDPAHR